MPQLLHLDDEDRRGPNYNHPNLGQRFRRMFPPAPIVLPTLGASIIKQVPASTANYTVGRLGYAVKGVIIHTMVGTLASCDTTFQNPARGASAHYGIPYRGYADAPVHQYVSEANIAWHCGRYYPDASHPLANTNTVGIEHADNGAYNSPRPSGLYEASSQLTREICARHHIGIVRIQIRKHKEVSELATGCPDSLDIERIVAMAAGTYGPLPVEIIGIEEDMIYVGPFHPKTATLKVFTAGQSRKERTLQSPAVSNFAVGAPVVVTGYSYSTSPAQSADLGGGVPGPDYVWWQVAGAWIPDAILDTTGVAGVPAPAIPATEPLDTLFATQAQVKAIPGADLTPVNTKIAAVETRVHNLEAIPPVDLTPLSTKISALEAAPVKPHKHTVGTTDTSS